MPQCTGEWGQTVVPYYAALEELQTFRSRLVSCVCVFGILDSALTAPEGLTFFTLHPPIVQ